MISSFIWACLVVGLADFGVAELHPMSRSLSRVELEEDSVRWTLRVQAESIREVLPELDTDADEVLSRAEADQGSAEIASYLGEHYGVRGVEDSGDEWPGRLARIGEPEGSVDEVGFVWIEAVWVHEVSEEVSSIGVRMELFEDTSPDHVDVFELKKDGVIAYTALFSAMVPGAWIPELKVEEIGFVEWVWWGIQHILTGYDHLAFLLAMLMCVRGAKHAAIVVTAFTAAHSVTLAMAALDVVSVSERFVELVIALSITFIALGAFASEPRRWLWVEVALFGFVHGLGFAGFLGDALSGEEQLLSGLVGFNLGVELGQLAFLLPAGLLIALWRRGRVLSGGWWVPAGLRMTTSALVGIAGVYWFA